MPDTPLLDRLELEKQFGGYDPTQVPSNLPNIPYESPAIRMPSDSPEPPPSALTSLENFLLSKTGSDGKMKGGSVARPLSELTSNRYDFFIPGDYNNEDAYAQGQGWTAKMVNSVGKGLLLTGTTFLQSTFGMVNGLTRAIGDGRAASFYDNDFNRKLDEINKAAEDALPNYYTDVEKNANWYSPDKLFTANFFWNGIVKNLGFAAGAALAGGVYAAGLKALPLTSRLFSVGKAAETLAATEEGLLAANKVDETYGKVRGLSDKFLSSYNLLNPGGRALVAGLSTTGEAGFEAYHNLNEYRDNLIEKYKEENNGLAPKGADLDKINELAEGIGNTSFLANVGLLSVTNYIQFPKILGSTYTGEKGIINSLTREIKDIGKTATGEYAEKAITTKGGKFIATLDKIRPYTFSTSEAFEEGAQYAISVGTKDYYNKKYRGQATSWLESMGEGILQTVNTNEGMENVLIGGFSGALMQAKGRYQENVAKNRNTADAIQQFNKFELSDFTNATIDSVNRGTVLQQEREELLKKGDVKGSKDKEMDYIINYLSPRVKYGRYDLVMQDIADYRTLASTDQGFAQLQAEGRALPTDTKEAYVARLDALQKTADNVKSLYQSLNLRYGSIIDKEGNPIYTPAVMDQMVYAATKVADYDTRIPKLADQLTLRGVNVNDIIDSIIVDKKPNKEATSRALDAINNMNVISDVKGELKQSLIDIIDMSLDRNQFMQEYDTIKNSPQEFYDKKAIPFGAKEELAVSVEQVDPNKPGKTITKKLEVGEDYYLRKPFTRTGNTIQVAPRIKVLSQTLGGEFEVEMPNGNVEYLTPQEFKQFDLADAPISVDELNGTLESAINNVLSRKKYADVTVPEGTSPIDFVNDLNNSELMDDVEAEFEKLSQRLMQQREQEEKVIRNAKVLDQALQTQDRQTLQTEEFSKTYEPDPKKATELLPRATLGVVKGKPHQMRANKFGEDLEKLPNRQNIRGVYITSANEDLLIPGLVDHLRVDVQGKIDETIERDQIIAMVMVDQFGNLVGVDGERLPDGADKINSAIYQVYPTASLTWSEEFGGKEMFREGTADNVKEAVREQYKKWRDGVISSQSQNPRVNEFHTIAASFGVPLYVRDDKGNIDWNTKTSVVDAGLITAAQIERDPLIRIPKDNEPLSIGTVSFKNPMGKPFLEVPGGVVKLRNRNLTKKEAETIYQALLQLAKNMQNVDEWVTSDSSVRLLSWLKSIVYWGIPTTQAGVRKPAGYNSVFWEKDGTGRKLMLSVKDAGKNFSMTPLGLEQNKDAIVAQLQTMFNNINSFMAQNLSEPYEEITSIAEDGTVESRMWPSYQTYLLSNQNPQGGKRSNEELPLSTPMVPKTSDDVMNRMGIYFYTTDTADDFAIPKPIKPASVISSQTITAAGAPQRATAPAQTAPATPAAPAAPTYVLDGKTINRYVSPGGKVINFKAPSDVTQETVNQKIILGTQSGDYAEVAATITKAGKNPEIELKKIIYNAIAPEIDRINLDMAPVVIGGNDPAIVAASQNLGQPISPNVMTAINTRIADVNDEALREMVSKEISQYEREDWTKVEAFLKKALPNIPVYRVKNIIQATNGRQAWGMYKDGAIYVYTNAEVGTAYHEVFHAVWRMFADSAEREGVMNELRNRKGSFFDRKSATDVNYSEATDNQLEEKLAEEFRDYVQEGKVPAKPTDGRPFVVKLFADLVKFIKEFFVGPQADSNTEALFAKIGNGYYKNYSPYYSSLAYAKEGVIDIEDAFATSDSEFSLVGITDKQRSEIINEMTYLTVLDVINTDEGLFSVPKINKSELYDKLKTQLLLKVGNKAEIAKQFVKNGIYSQEAVDPIITSTTELMQHIDNQWDAIVKRYEEYLKAYSITFDENDDMQRRDEDKIKESDFVSAEKIDGFRKANGAIKLLLASIPIVDANGKAVPSSIGGTQLLPISQTYISVMNNVHDATSVESMLDKLRTMAANDPNYRALYKRLTKAAWNTEGINLDGVTTEAGAQLLGAFWQTFKKQDPEVKNVFILENGQVVVGDASLSNAANQLRQDYINNITQYAKNNKGYFKFNERQQVFLGDAAKVRSKRTETPAEISDFLDGMGIAFSKEEIAKLGPNDFLDFKDVVKGIKMSIMEGQKIATFSGRSLNISNRLLELGLYKAKLSNPQFDSTYFNISGERVQSFLGPNAVYDLYNFLSQVKVLNEGSLSGTQYEYLLSDDFTTGSVMLKRMFASDGVPKSDARKDQLFRTGYAGGTINEETGKNKESSKLTYKERVTQEINLNLAGYYMNLVPGDASLEWIVKMGNAISLTSLSRGRGDVYNIFKEYFISEMKVSRDPNRPFVQAPGRKRTDLRFFKAILGQNLHDKIVADTTSDPVTIFDSKEFGEKIRTAIDIFIDTESNRTKSLLTGYGIVENTASGYVTDGLSLPSVMNETDYNRHIDMLSINYIIANIELHKLVYGDPYQYKDELKRTKSFNSPRQALVNNSPKMNGVYNSVWNKSYGTGDIGFTNFTREYFRTTSYKDVQAYSSLKDYGVYDETDGAGIINMRANRHFRIRAGKWNAEEEKQYKYDVAWEKRDKGFGLSRAEEGLLREGNPGVQSAYVNIKPIVSGNKANGQPYNEVVLDKFALYVLSYRLIKEMNMDSNLLNLHDKMQREDIDYVVFDSGRKVGAVDSNDVYNEEDGSFNEADYNDGSIVNVPYSIISVQSEVPSKEESYVTRGSQMTKLITMDFLEAGVPVDFFPSKTISQRYKAWMKLSEDDKVNRSPIYAEIKNNQKLIQELTQEGYLTTLDRLGIKEVTFKDVDGVTRKRFEIVDKAKAVNTLRDEVLSREVSDNISDALQGFFEGKAVLEATPAYQQIRNILYSIADKNIISPKVNGGLRVQIPQSLFESGNVKVEEVNGKMAYTSDTLKFYEDDDGKRYCEIMVGRWFESPLSDDELMDYFNNTEEGKKQLEALAGVAFRIPTQKQNSIDAFRIKKFLPREFRDSVVVPSALVKKVGSDFDIDKLSIYLKNVYVKDGKPKLVPTFATKAEALEKLGKMFDKGEFLSPEQEKQLDRYIAEETIGAEEFMNDQSSSAQLLKGLLSDLFSEERMVFEFTKGIKARDQIINVLYKKGLENQYFESSQKLVESKANFQRLIKPNSAQQLKDLAKFVADKTTGGSFDYNNTGNLLSRGFMSSLRHAFVRGKYAIGIAAVSQTNHSLNQRQLIYVDRTRLENLSATDRFWLGDGTIKFDKYNTIDVEGKGTVAMLSGVTNADGQDISDIIGQFIDGYVDISKGPWIMELGATPNVASTWLFLAKIGVPIDTISYFMNQTSVRNYLRSIENAGYSYLFIDSIYNDIMDVYLPKAETKEEEDANMQLLNEGTIPSKTVLRRNVGLGTNQMDRAEKLQQAIILKEFVKYAKMAEQLFQVTQGTNWDTATFNDPYLVFKKELQFQKAQNTIISSAEEVMSNSFIGDLAETIKDVRNAFAPLLLSDQPRVRSIIQNVLAPYAFSMSDRDFVKLARKAVNDLFDFAVQKEDQSLNVAIQDILLNDGGVATEVLSFVNDVKANPDHPLNKNYVVNIISADPSKRVGENIPNNLKVKGIDNRAYDQNNIIYAFRELRDYLKDKSDLYDRLVTLSILQSGLSPSPISFTSVLPYEDFEKIYNQTLSRLEAVDNLEDFYNLGVFQRNNWNNDDVVPYSKAFTIETAYGPVYNPSMAFLPKPVREAVAKETIPPVVSKSIHSYDGNFEYIVYRWEKGADLLTKEERDAGLTVAKKKADMRKAGDYSFIQKGLFKKVRDGFGKAFEHTGSKGRKYYIYKAVNAWGDGYRANEFWDTEHLSKVNNGFVPSNGADDSVIISEFMKKPDKTTTSGTARTKGITMAPANVEKIEQGIKTTTIRSEREGDKIGIPVGQSEVRTIGNKSYQVTNRGLLTIEEAGGREAMLKSEGVATEEDLMYHQSKRWFFGNGKLYVYDIAPLEGGDAFTC